MIPLTHASFDTADTPSAVAHAPTEIDTTAAADAQVMLPASRAHGVKLFIERYALVLVWAAMAAIFAVAQPEFFLRSSTVQVVAGGAAVYVLLGIGALFPAIVGELDLSTAFVMGLSATLVPTLVSLHGVSTPVAVVVALIVAIACGALMGYVVVHLNVDPLVTTLGMGTALIGLAGGLSHDSPVSGLSEGFGQLATSRFLGLQMIVWYAVALAVFAAYLLAFTPLGRHMLFVGSNPEVARLAGVRVDRIRMGAFVAGSLIAGLAGVVLSAQLRGFQASSAPNYLLPAVAALFMSSVVVRPGRFNALGVLVGSGFIATGTFGLQLMGFSGWTQQLFYGAALVLAVVIVSIVRRHTKAI